MTRARPRSILGGLVAVDLRAFHRTNAGITSRVLARGGSYARLEALVPAGSRTLDLACGDGELLAQLHGRRARAFGIDASPEECALAAARGVAVACADAAALPLPAASVDTVACHLAFMLLPDPAAVTRELARVLAPGGQFLAVLGGGPTAGARDAFHAFLDELPARPAQGDRRARTEAGWHELFASPRWTVAAFERWAIDLSGSFLDVWAFLASSYELAPADHDRVRAAVRAAFPGERVPCTVVMFLARATLER